MNDRHHPKQSQRPPARNFVTVTLPSSSPSSSSSSRSRSHHRHRYDCRLWVCFPLLLTHLVVNCYLSASFDFFMNSITGGGGNDNSGMGNTSRSLASEWKIMETGNAVGAATTADANTNKKAPQTREQATHSSNIAPESAAKSDVNAIGSPPQELEKKAGLRSTASWSAAAKPRADNHRNKTTIVSQEQQPETFSSCLLVMDENHRLPEWLAYHYYMLPLRHLVIMVDPRSKTSPLDILNRWRPYMEQIELWNDTHIQHKPKHTTNPDLLMEQHRKRQSMFFQSCAKHFHKLGKTFVTFHDVDEFMYLDKDHVPDAAERMAAQPGSVLTLLQELRNMTLHHHHQNTSNNTLLLLQNQTYFDDAGALYNFARRGFQGSCFVLSRIHFNGKETTPDRVQNQVPPFLNGSDFETLRYIWRTCNGDELLNGIGKSLLVVGHGKNDGSKNMKPKKLPPFFDPPRGIHRIFETCPLTNFWYSPLRLRHYLGSWEYYTSRDDARVGIARSREAYEYKSQHMIRGKRWGRDDDVRQWLAGFRRLFQHNQTLIQHLLTGLAQLPENHHNRSLEHWGMLPWAIDEEIEDHYEEGKKNFASWLKERFDVQTLRNGTVVATRRLEPNKTDEFQDK